ncbi:ECF transporter S component [Heliobacterium chlorum]|uniref:ECF transporter S component n=1 Tax=Heliobacterium chlorum TaxID=2698 RepID=A0ABR7T4J2_HELCL|nr:ECF transporter S component [Heliobacterium chlorum]MBC9785698.1 ECF transporter S component [Heliobacterium chlorum]
MNTRLLTRTAVLIALALVLQQIKVQWIAGPAVNALLIIATGYNGLLGGILLGSLTPVLAFLIGIMPLAIVLPVIAVGNILFCTVFYTLRKKSDWLGLAAGALLKFSFMALAVNYVIQVRPAVANALSLPQLFTAITGGFVGIVLLRYLKREAL